MIGKKAIFSGSSHFQGLGLEIELSDRYNSVEWLKENGVQPVIDYYVSDMDIHKYNRWPYLLSQKLGVEEWNCYGGTYKSELGDGTDIEFLKKLLNHEIDVTNVSYIFQELTSATRLRWNFVSYTPAELIEMINKNKVHPKLIKELESWLDENEQGKTYSNFSTLFKEVLKKYPNIKFYIIDWYGSYYDLLSKEFQKNIFTYIDRNKKPNRSFHDGLTNDRLRINDSSFCYNSNRTWEVNWFDEHANKEGQKHISEILYKQIQKSLI